MADCIVLPVLNTGQAMVLTEAVAVAGIGEGVSDGFTLDDILPEEAPPETSDHEGTIAGDGVVDPLQTLIEDMSGITGALRPSDRAQPEARAMPAPTTPPAGTGPQLAGPDLPDGARDGLPLDPLPAGSMVWTEGAMVDVQTQPGDPVAASVAAAPRDEAVVPAEPRSSKTAPVPVARQIAEAVVTAREDRIEIALAPEELGRIRIVMSGPDHSPHVVIWAERPEVLDQLRRNAAFLQECLGDAGMADASFEFQGDTPKGSRQDQPTPPLPDRPAPDLAAPVHIIPLTWRAMAIPVRLDIRI